MALGRRPRHMAPPEPWRDAPPDGLTPEQAFSLVGNATRLSILRALWEAKEPFEPAGLSFSELRERAGVDDSGQFNYHLDKLVPRFVRRVDDAYQLSFAGNTVSKAVIAGTVTTELEREPVEVDADCPYCGAPVTIQRLSGFNCVACTECDGHFQAEAVPGLLFAFELPPAGHADRTPEEVLRATLSYELYRYDARSEGVCPDCGGRVETWLEVCEDHPESGFCDACAARDRTLVRWLCGSCREDSTGPGYALALRHPAVGAFLQDRGLEPRRGSWELMKVGGQFDERVESTDPIRVRYTLEYEGHTIELTVEGDGSVRTVDA